MHARCGKRTNKPDPAAIEQMMSGPWCYTLQCCNAWHAPDTWDMAVEDVSGLTHVHELSLAGCKQVKDVSALGGTHTLSLRGCSGIEDVDALGNVHTLDLHGCSSITDVSALGNVYASSTVQRRPNGDQFDFARLPARTPHGAYLW